VARRAPPALRASAFVQRSLRLQLRRTGVACWRSRSRDALPPSLGLRRTAVALAKAVGLAASAAPSARCPRGRGPPPRAPRLPRAGDKRGHTWACVQAGPPRTLTVGAS